MGKPILLTIPFIIGLVFVIVSLTGFIFLKTFVKREISKEIQLNLSSDSYQRWQKVQASIYVKFHFFHVKNPYEVEHFDAKPIVIQRGPYVFKEERSKTNITFNVDENSVSYNEVKSYRFKKKRSNGTLHDLVTVVNLPILGIIKTVDKLVHSNKTLEFLPKVLNLLITNQIEGMSVDPNEVGLFTNRTVGQMLFDGYHIKLFQQIRDAANQSDINISFKSPLVNDTFGLFYLKNNTMGKSWTIHTGYRNSGLYTHVEKYNDKDSLNWWNGSACNMLNGTDGVQFPPGITSNQTLYVFDNDICRSVFFDYDRDVEYKDIELLRFKVPERHYNECNDKTCFCTKLDYEKQYCNVSGILDMSSCMEVSNGAPVVMSAPQFYQASKWLKDGVEGLEECNETACGTFLHVEPLTGIVFEAIRQLQINGEVIQNYAYDILKNVTHKIIPITRIKEVSKANDEAVEEFKSKVTNRISLYVELLFGIIVFGSVLIILAIGCYVRFETHN